MPLSVLVGHGKGEVRALHFELHNFHKGSNTKKNGLLKAQNMTDSTQTREVLLLTAALT